MYVAGVILKKRVSRLLNLLLRLVAFLLFLNPQCLASISRWITASSSWKRFCLFVCRALSSIMVICMLTAIRLLLTFVMSFFFSSRSRHTNSYGDWSSDVCSSDLRNSSTRSLRATVHACTSSSPIDHRPPVRLGDLGGPPPAPQREMDEPSATLERHIGRELDPLRSEERRVGKEGTPRRPRQHASK